VAKDRRKTGKEQPDADTAAYANEKPGALQFIPAPNDIEMSSPFTKDASKSSNYVSEGEEEESSKTRISKGYKKGRRGMVIRNKYKHLKIYYVNIRGIKSKMTTLSEIILEEKPNIICLNETLLKEEENIDIKKLYKFYNNNEKENKWGVTIGIENALKHITVEVDRKSDDFESLWVKISNDRIKLRIGNIYAPQESRTEIEVYERMYDHIKQHKQETEKLNEKFLVVGDFNCKIGEKNNLKGETGTTKSGKILKQMVKEQNISILNKNKKCIGKWTRIQGDQKSVIDYAMIDKMDGEHLKKMVEQIY